MRLEPDGDLIAAEAHAREALNALRAGAAADGTDGTARTDATQGADAENFAGAVGGEAERAGAAPSAAENLARVEAQRQREWLYRGYRRARGGWKRD